MTLPTESHPHASDAVMPYAPAIRIDNPTRMLFLSGVTGAPLYHEHPHLKEETTLPDDMAEQTRRAADALVEVLEAEGMTFRNIARMTLYITDMREIGEMQGVLREYLGDWHPAMTLLCVNNLSSPGARVEIECTAVEGA